MRTVVLCSFGMVLIALGLWHRPADADDFAPFYRAATLTSEIPHGKVYAKPYWSPAKNADGRFLPYLRIPSYAAALKILTVFPYAMARRVWIAVLILATFACVGLFPAERNHLAVALAFSFPLADALMIGQDIILVLLIALAASSVFSGGREFLAGLVASLLAIKPTYLPAAGLVFLASSRRGVYGFLTGCALQLALSFAVGGMAWPSEYFDVLRSPLLDTEPGRMPNLHGVAFSLSLPVVVYAIAAIALYLFFWFACRKLGVADGLIVGLAIGLIASPHAKVYDGVILIPLLVRVASLRNWVGVLACAALTPVLYLMVLMGNPQLTLAGTSLLAVTTLAAAVRLYQLHEMQVVAISAAAPASPTAA